MIFQKEIMVYVWASLTQDNQPKGIKRDNTTGIVPIKVTLRGVPLTIAAVGEQEVLHILTVWPLVLIIQHAMHIRHIVLLCPAPLYDICPHYLINGTIFEESYRTQNVC